MVVLLIIFVCVAVIRYFYKRRLTEMRDNADFTTIHGKAVIAACNKKLDFLHGYGVFKKRSNRGDTT